MRKDSAAGQGKRRKEARRERGREREEREGEREERESGEIAIESGGDRAASIWPQPVSQAKPNLPGGIREGEERG